jgi:hypothetical protein
MTEFTVEMWVNDRWDTYCIPTINRPFAESMYEQCHRRWPENRVRLVQRTILKKSQSEE